ncbi:MAG TPA: hypothetical protein VNI02_04715 [Blastocatellia bacterium]|jgi:hypothetical protein|nr:hypothetical protein [Blastocatellia bacterium]
MRKLSSFLLISLVLIAPAAKADTIHLKNGSILKGKVASFADDQFVVMLDTGSGRYMSRALVYIGDVARIEFDSVPGAASDAMARETNPAARTASPEPRAVSPSDQPRNNQPGEAQRNSQPSEAQPRESSPRETNPRATSPQRETSQPEPQPAAREPEPSQPDRPAPSTAPTLGTADSERAARKPGGSVKATSVDVVGKRDWTSTGLIISRGDHIRITATGVVTIDPVGGRTAGPEGAADVADPKKLMQDQPTGALIGVIGADNDDFIFIGRSAEFTATRGGLLFLSVNEGTLADNTGTFKATIEIQPRR